MFGLRLPWLSITTEPAVWPTTDRPCIGFLVALAVLVVDLDARVSREIPRASLDLGEELQQRRRNTPTPK